MFSIVVVYNNERRLNEILLPSLKNQTAKFELIPLDNTVGQFKSAAKALNNGGKQAKGKYLIFVHQDVSFSPNWLSNVLEQISLVDKTNQQWGVLGLMGVTAGGEFAGHIIDLHGHLYRPPLPREVLSLDEVCLVIRKDSNLRFDESLGGFHLYGADLCLQAKVKGLANYAIDACVRHLGQGKMGQDFWATSERLYAKWKVNDCPTFVIETTCGVFRLRSGVIARLRYDIKRLQRRLRNHLA